jgi:hypothetical protein
MGQEGDTYPTAGGSRKGEAPLWAQATIAIGHPFVSMHKGHD